jgi:hypothetical protein
VQQRKKRTQEIGFGLPLMTMSFTLVGRTPRMRHQTMWARDDERPFRIDVKVTGSAKGETRRFEGSQDPGNIAEQRCDAMRAEAFIRGKGDKQIASLTIASPVWSAYSNSLYFASDVPGTHAV